MAEEDTVMLLREISGKLDQLIILTKMGRQDEIVRLRQKLKSDPILSQIRKLSDGSLSSSEIKTRVSKTTGKSESLIEKKVYELVDNGIIVPIKSGKGIRYFDSGLID
ncbi:hypothetical protein ES703_08373 [subsurface metagenome]